MEHHHEAFFYWEQLIATQRLTVPFDLVHVDAHSDISSEGTGAHIYVLSELLSHTMEKRLSMLDRTRVTFANFPVFAAALGWLKSFTWVRPPTGDDGILEYYMGDGSIHLRHYPEGTFTGPFTNWRQVITLAEDPPIPTSIVTTGEFCADGPFDFVTLCRSPQYTPAAADTLYEVIREYVDEAAGIP